MKGKLTAVILWVLLAIVLVGLLFPAKAGVDDGGTNIYDAVLYTVEYRHTMRADVKGYFEGTAVEVFGHTFYDDTLEKTSVFGDIDAIVNVSLSTENGIGTCEVPADELDEIKNWLRSFRFLNTVKAEKMLPGMEFFTITITYADGRTYTGPLGMMKTLWGKYYVWGDPIPGAFYRTLGIDSEE